MESFGIESSPHHIVQIPPSTQAAAPVEVSIPDATVKLIHSHVNQLQKAVCLKDFFDGKRLREALEDGVSTYSLEIDREQLGISTFAHARLNPAELVLQHRLGDIANQFIVSDDANTLPESHADARPEPRGAPSLRHQALGALVDHAGGVAVAQTLKTHLRNADSLQAQPHVRPDSLESVMEHIAGHMLTHIRTSNGCEADRRNLLAYALAKECRTQGLRSGRDAVIDAYRAKLREDRTTDGCAAFGSFVGAGLSLGVAAAALGLTIKAFMINEARTEVFHAAQRVQADCVTSHLVGCPVVPITRTQLGPEPGCADAAEAACRSLSPIEPGEGYVWAGFGGMLLDIPLVPAFGLGGLVTLVEAARLTGTSVTSQRLLANVPKPRRTELEPKPSTGIPMQSARTRSAVRENSAIRYHAVDTENSALSV